MWLWSPFCRWCSWHLRNLPEITQRSRGSSSVISDSSTHLELVTCELFLDFKIYSKKLKRKTCWCCLWIYILFFHVLFSKMRLQRRLSDTIFRTQLLQDCLYWFVGWQSEGRYPRNNLIVKGAGRRFHLREESSPSCCSQNFIIISSDLCIWSFVIGIHINNDTFAT